MALGMIMLGFMLVVTPVARPSASSLTFDYPGAVYTQALGVNKAGSIVGIYQDTTGLHGFLHRGSDFSTGFSAINVPNAFLTEAQGINDRGDVVGLYLDRLGTHGFVHHGLNFSAGYTKIDIPFAKCCVSANGINNHREIVGTYIATFHTHGFVHRGTDFSKGYSTLDVPGATETFVNGINRKGDIVGQYVAGPGMAHGFAVHDGVFSMIDVPSTIVPAPVPHTTAVNGVNSRGTFVGTYVDLNQLDGFLGQGSTFQLVSISGSQETLPYGINDKGAIVGVTSQNGAFHGFVIAAPVTDADGNGDRDSDRGDGNDHGQGGDQDQGGEGD